jgi:hypothetical protein
MRKTPIIRVATAPIDKLEAEARKQHDEDMRTYRTKMNRWKQAQKEGKDDEEPVPPRLARYLVEGTTIEALTEILRGDSQAKQRTPADKVLIRQDEMSGWIANFDRYAGSRGGDGSDYIRLYNGGRHTIDRIGRGSFAMPNWSACILGGIQPEPIQRIASHAADDGLLQRFCYCVPAAQRRGEDRCPDTNGIARYHDLFPALAALAPDRRPWDADPRRIVLHTEAHAHRIKIDDLAEALAGMPDASNRLKSALGKWPGLWARLTLLFHLIDVADARARDPQRSIAYVANRAAIAVTAYMRDILLPHLLRADRVMFSTAQTGHARWIAGFVLSKGEQRIAARDIMRAYGALRAPEKRRELQDVMTSLEAMGWVRPEGRRESSPTTAWEVNPAVHTRFADRARREREAREAAKGLIRGTLGKHLKGGER